MEPLRRPPLVCPLRTVTATLAPPLLFVVAHATLSGVRAWVASLDLVLVTATQTWRVIGLTFVMVWGLGGLPGAFAAPAGFGDVAVGLLATWVTIAVARRSPGWKTGSYALIAVGILDFVTAISTALLSEPGRILSFAGAPSGAAMQAYPLVLFPAYIVPAFFILHIIAWIKLRQEV